MRRVAVLVVVLLAACCLTGLAAASPGHPTLVAIYPNPVAAGDAGEFVTLRVPTGTNLSRYALTDGETTVELPNVDASTLDGAGVVTFSTAANRTAWLLDRPVRQLPGRLQLANGGDRVTLLRNGEAVDAVAYGRAREGDVLWVEGGDRRWRPLRATNRPVVTAGPGHVEAFVLPDAGGTPAAHLATAEDRILLAGYTLSSSEVARALRRAHGRNATVGVLVDGSPAGGIDRRQAAILDELVGAGIDVRVLGGDHARYRFHHAKYAVVDDRAVVTTENWKPAGTGGRASRGWGVVTNQSEIVDGLVETFRADAGWHDAIPWRAYRQNLTVSEDTPATGTFASHVDVGHFPVSNASLLVAPDNAEAEVLRAIDGAEESIWIQQAGVGGARQPFVRAAVDAARRGVSVRILLGNAWYNREDNEAVARQLEATATREDLDLEVRLVEPANRFERLHAKGAVIDGERVLVGSLNWNNHSARENREVALLLTGDRVGEYYQAVIRADWRLGAWRVTVGLVVGCLLGAVLAGRAVRRIRFEPVDR